MMQVRGAELKAHDFTGSLTRVGPHLSCTVLAQPHPMVRAADILITHHLVKLS